MHADLSEGDPDPNRSGERTARTHRPRAIGPEEKLGLQREEVVVCIPLLEADPLFAECLQSVLQNTEADVPILIVDDAGFQTGIPSPIDDLLASMPADGRPTDHQLLHLRQPERRGFARSLNGAFNVAAPADIVLLDSRCRVASGWLEGLRGAARSDSSIATASALADTGVLSVPERNQTTASPSREGTLSHVASVVREESLRLYPRLPTAIGHCLYIRRSALELVGGFDSRLPSDSAQVVDLSQRCLLHGLVHVAADDVFVLDRSGSNNRPERTPLIDERYPYYRRSEAATAAVEFGPLPRALSAARRAIKGLSVTIDARCLGPVVMGTQVHTLHVIRALSQTDRLDVRVILPPDLGDYAREQLAGLQRVELMPHTDVHPAMEKTTVAHRPYQVSDTNDLLMLRCAGERSVITHQDLIAFRNPGYFPGYPQWERYRRLTRQALAVADRVLFVSQHAATDALREDLLDSARASVAYNGVDHDPPGHVAPRPPAGVEQLGDRPMLLCLGADLRHKNRLFALHLLRALRDEHNWDGTLLLAGTTVRYGSSAEDEAAYLAGDPGLTPHVISISGLSDEEKAWALTRSSAVLYPTTYEGFGLVPFEAAASGRPCLFAPQTALAETLPHELATLVPWSARASAAQVHLLLSTPGAPEEQVRQIRAAGARFTWRSAAHSLINAYLLAAASPARLASELAADLAAAELERAESERKYNELWEALTPDARTLLTPAGGLTAEQTSALAAAARRPLLRRLLLGPTQLAYRMTAGRRPDPSAEPPKTPPEVLALHFAWANQEHMREQLADTDPEVLLPDP